MKCATLMMRAGKPGGGKGPLVADNRSQCLSAANMQVLFQMGGGVCMSANLGESVRLGKRVCEEDSAVTLRASDGKMGDNQSVVAIKQSFGINPQGGGKMLPFDKECGETLAIGHQGGVMTEQDISQMKYIVRRLTPIECERLTGLPDGWTIPKNLEVTDALVEEFREKHDTFKRIMAEYENEPPPKPTTAVQVRKWLEKITNPDTCPDAPRYKGCGNGWATNQPRWILLRLFAAEGIDPWWGEFDEAKEAKEKINVSDN